MVYLDDILVNGASQEEHQANLKEVLRRLAEAGLHLKKDKCNFGVAVVEYIGHQISKDGLATLDKTVRAVVEAPTPTDVTQVKSFLCMLTFYRRFLPNLATILQPLHQLLKKGQVFRWVIDHERAFDMAKELLRKPPVPEDKEQSVAFHSITMAPAEKNYSQVKKEASAMICGVREFHKYLWGRHFNIYTDHKPFLGLLGEMKPLPKYSSSRLQRWALLMQGFDYELIYRPGTSIANADALSRLPLLKQQTLWRFPCQNMC